MTKDKSSPSNHGGPEFQESWNLELAMYVLRHPTADAKVWAEAVEWLLLYGPEDIQEVLLSASMYATSEHFPNLKASGCTQDGELCYDIAEIAKALEIDVAEAQRILVEKEKSHGKRHGFEESETNTVQ